MLPAVSTLLLWCDIVSIRHSGAQASASTACRHQELLCVMHGCFSNPPSSLQRGFATCLVMLTRTRCKTDLCYHCTSQLQNGRWAMIGFLACIIVEAATGRGIIGQVFLYLRAVGLLGEASGF